MPPGTDAQSGTDARSGPALRAEDRRSLLGRLGRFGAWFRDDAVTPEVARHVERAGFGTLWVGRAAGDLRLIEELIEATTRLTVATGIVNIWTNPPDELARSMRRLESRHPGRCVLGIGAGHAETVGPNYTRPYSALVSYLDELDRHGLPASGRLLAALGPRMLALAANRAAGAVPYLVTPSFTRHARSVLGPTPLLAPDQKVILTSDPQRARAIAGRSMERLLSFSNYRASLDRMGLRGGEPDHAIGELFAFGDAAAVVVPIRAQLDAGADHVAVQVLGTADGDGDAYQLLGAALADGSGESKA